MSSLIKHFDKDNLHHAYLIEGDREIITKELLSFLEAFNIKESSQDLFHIAIDNFKINEARNLKDMSRERSVGEKKFFIISANHFAQEAQNTMLKLFEEPTLNTHFFLITPDVNALIPTLISRFYFIALDNEKNLKQAIDFLKLSPRQRVDFVKKMLVAPDDEMMDDSIRTQSLSFLNSLEIVLHSKMDKDPNYIQALEQILQARKYLRQPGASPKMLLESVALLI